jgi:hypothetical protein
MNPTTRDFVDICLRTAEVLQRSQHGEWNPMVMGPHGQRPYAAEIPQMTADQSALVVGAFYVGTLLATIPDYSELPYVVHLMQADATLAQLDESGGLDLGPDAHRLALVLVQIGYPDGASEVECYKFTTQGKLVPGEAMQVTPESRWPLMESFWAGYRVGRGMTESYAKTMVDALDQSRRMQNSANREGPSPG